MQPDSLIHAAPEDRRAPTTSACERCGSFEVLEIAGQTLCSDCIATASCGCAGHGGSDED